MQRLYVGNLSYSATEDTIRSLFEKHGKVDSVSVITDRVFRTIQRLRLCRKCQSDAEAQKAITGLNGKEIDGRALTVNEARPKVDRGSGGGGRSRW